MSLHVYIAREGWTKTPISEADWKDAISRIAELEIQPNQNRKHPGPPLAVLKSKKGRGLELMQGFVHTQNPNEELVAVMFELARILGGKVYSEKAKPYESVEDWRKKTRSYYVQREKRINKSKRENRIRVLRILLFVAAVSLAVWLIR